MSDEHRTDGTRATLGDVLRKARSDLNMSQRDVENATGKEVSNAYISQLESGKITRPSPHILYALSAALQISYETLMERAGYISASGLRPAETKHGQAATFAIDNLSAEEEKALLKHLQYLRWERGQK